MVLIRTVGSHTHRLPSDSEVRSRARPNVICSTLNTTNTVVRRRRGPMRAPKTLPTRVAALSGATHSRYCDQTPRILGPKSSAAADRMLTWRPGCALWPLLALFVARLACFSPAASVWLGASRALSLTSPDAFEAIPDIRSPAKQRQRAGARVIPGSLWSANSRQRLQGKRHAGGCAGGDCLSVPSKWPLWLASKRAQSTPK